MPTKNGFTAFSLVERKSKLKVKLQPENILGRESGLKTETMSRRHCQIVTKENRWFLADLDSTNGTFLNGKKMKSREWYSMKVGDELEFGSMIFQFNGPAAKAEANIEMPEADTVSKSTGFGIRLGAYVVDFIAAMALNGTAAVLVGPKSPLLALVQLISIVLVVIVPMVLRSQSVGKMALGLMVVRLDGEPLKIGRILLREIVGKFLGLFCIPVALTGAAMSVSPLAGSIVFIASVAGLIFLYVRQRETLWDLWFSTRVVPVPEVEF